MSLVTDFRARREAQLMNVDALCRYVRTRARITGLQHTEILAVDSEARAMVTAGEQNHDVIERCAELSRAIVKQRASVSA